MWFIHIVTCYILKHLHGCCYSLSSAAIVINVVKRLSLTTAYTYCHVVTLKLPRYVPGI